MTALPDWMDLPDRLSAEGYESLPAGWRTSVCTTVTPGAPLASSARAWPTTTGS
jgi:hypothetical protein